MTWQVFQLASLLNLVFCMGTLWTAICRLNSNLCRTHLAARARYTLLAGGATVCGMQPVFFGFAIAPGTAFFSGCVLAALLLGMPRWLREPQSPQRRKDDL